MNNHQTSMRRLFLFILVLAVVIIPVQGVLAYAVGGDDQGAVHEYMAEQAALVSGNYEILSALTTIQSGARHEDLKDHITDRSGVGDLFVTITHFWDADKGDNDPVDMIIVGENGINSWQKAQVLWGMALGHYADGDYGTAYEFLGHVAHLLCDQSVPAHAHEDAHASETFEKDYMYLSRATLTTEERSLLIDLGPVEIPEAIDPLYYLFYTVNQIGDYYPSDDYGGDADTRGGWMDQVYADLGVYPLTRPVSDADCAVIRQYSYMFAIRAVAALYDLFESEATSQSSLTVVIDRVQAQDIHDEALADPDCRADFFARVTINNFMYWNEGDQVINEDDISPHWCFGRNVGVTGSIPVVIQIWDEDEDPNDDDKTDLDPVDGPRDLDLVVDLATGAISGDMSGTCGQQLTIAGAGDQNDASRIWFRILLPNVPPTAHAGPDQVVDEGDTVTLSGTFEDPNVEDTHTFLWHLESSSNGQSVPDATTENMNFVPIDNGTYIFSFTVTDNHGAQGSDTVQITANNVAPVVAIDWIQDETGADIPGDVPVALAGLEINLAGHFTDVGLADTHVASISWGDGLADHSLTTFNDCTGGVTGMLGHAHVYALPGLYPITVTVTDDDDGVGTAMTSLEVVDAAGAMEWVIESLDALAADWNIRQAIDCLQGEHYDTGLAANGALDMLEQDLPYVALQKIKQAMIYLEAAEEANPGWDLTEIKGLLTLAAKSICVQMINEAVAVAIKANDLAKLDAAHILVTTGDTCLAAHDYVGAIGAYQDAAQMVMNIK